MTFDYSNLSGRPPGRFLEYAGRVLPGVRKVQEQVAPYAAAWERHNRDAVAASGPLWITLGDSMAQGIGATGFDRGWPGQLAAELPEHRLVNLSVSGGVIEDLVQRQLPAMESLGRQLDQAPDLVTVIIGSNDLFNRDRRRALPAVLPELLERLPAGAIIASQPGGRPGAREFNRQLDDAAPRRGFVIAEFRDPRMQHWRGKLAADRFHPNDRGYAGMAQIMSEALPRRTAG